MELSERKTKKIRDDSSNRNLWTIVFLVSLPLALILTVIFWLQGIKTPFWSERGTFRHRWFRGYIAVFFFLAFYIASTITIFYILFFLLKSLIQKKNRSERTKASKYILLFLGDQLLFNFFLILLWKGKTKSNSIMVMLISFLAIIFNSFFMHYLFSKPVMKFLIQQYPYYFSKIFHQETKLIMKVDGLKFEKIQTTEWPIMITLILINFWILTQFFYLTIFK